MTVTSLLHRLFYQLAMLRLLELSEDLSLFRHSAAGDSWCFVTGLCFAIHQYTTTDTSPFNRTMPVGAFFLVLNPNPRGLAESATKRACSRGKEDSRDKNSETQTTGHSNLNFLLDDGLLRIEHLQPVMVGAYCRYDAGAARRQQPVTLLGRGWGLARLALRPLFALLRLNLGLCFALSPLFLPSSLLLPSPLLLLLLLFLSLHSREEVRVRSIKHVRVKRKIFL